MISSTVRDYLVVGAGIVGLSIARELKRRNPERSVAVLEKEPMPGKHASGRNSGVLHSGIYYAPDSLKARVCTQGAREMTAYCEERKLPLNRLGKILVPVEERDGPQLDVLASRAKANGVQVERIDEAQLREMEPEVRSATGNALFVPQTSVGSPLAVIHALLADVQRLGVVVECDTGPIVLNPTSRRAEWARNTVSYGHLINAAGLQADLVAHRFGVGENYTLLPFKGLYWKLDPASRIQVRHLVYPVPDLRVPFLGVHTTTSVEGVTYLGPTAVPAWGRENYRGWDDVTAPEFVRIGSHLVRQFVAGRDGFRRLAWQEGRRSFKPWFADAARALLPRLEATDLLPCDKVGIRAQLLNRATGRLVNDFVVERGPSSTHVLNAISPAWTSAFPFARFVTETFIEK